MPMITTKRYALETLEVVFCCVDTPLGIVQFRLHRRSQRGMALVMRLGPAAIIIRRVPASHTGRQRTIALLAENSALKLLAAGKTDAAGMYVFKIPDVGYHVVATGDKAHVANLASVDIG